jgi:hypothetical protein
VEDRRGRKRVESIKFLREEKEKPKAEDAEFDAMVRTRVEGVRAEVAKGEVRVSSRRSAGRSAGKGKSEDRMIESLRDIQSTLRSKLQVIQQEGELAASTLPPPRRRNNDEIIK